MADGGAPAARASKAGMGEGKRGSERESGGVRVRFMDATKWEERGKEKWEVAVVAVCGVPMRSARG